MKVVHVVYECVPGRFRGGVQKSVYELACAQASCGLDVAIWTLDLGRDDPRLDELPVDIRYFSSNAIGTSRWSLELWQALHLVQDLDVIHAHNTFHLLNAQVSKYCRRTNTKNFFSPHGALNPKLMSTWSAKSLKKKLYNWLIEIPNLNASSGIFALSQYEERQLREIGVSAPIFLTGNGIDARVNRVSREYARRNLGIENSAPVLLYIGRLNAIKNIELLIKCFERVHADQPDALFLIAGEREPTQYVRKLDSLVTQSRLDKAVRWLGYVDERGKRLVLAAADVFVHASKSEGMADAILEAMANEVPTIVTPGCHMTPAARSHALIECAEESEALASAVSFLFSMPDKRVELGRHGAHYVRKVHSWERIANKTLEVYQSAPS